MIPFRTTPEQIVRLAAIVTAMAQAGVPLELIAAADDLARADAGIFGLMELWSTCSDPAERDAVLADLQELVDAYREAPREPIEKPYIRYSELPSIATDVVAFKRKLRDLIDRHGGVSAVAAKAGIPQPSLSRMLASASMPRRTTLYKLANAMGLPESSIVTEWVQ